MNASVAADVLAEWLARGAPLQVLVRTDAAGARHRIVGRLLELGSALFVTARPATAIFLPPGVLEIAAEVIVSVDDAGTQLAIVLETATLLIRDYDSVAPE